MDKQDWKPVIFAKNPKDKSEKDKITNKMFKCFNEEIGMIITEIFNKYIETWKIEKELIEG